MLSRHEMASGEKNSHVTATCRFEFGVSESIPAAIKRLVEEQADLATSALCTSQPDQSIHRVRVACKRIRAVLALLPPGKDVQKLDDAASTISHLLSASRDATVMQHWLTKLPRSKASANLLKQVDAERLAGIENLEETFAEVAKRLTRIRTPIRKLDIHRGFKTIRPGLLTAYDRARSARLGNETAAHWKANQIHRWRKRVKRHGYHVELFLASAPEFYTPRLARLRRLGSHLGDWHDLSLVAHRVTDPHTLAHIEAEQTALIRALIVDGKHLFAEDTDVIKRQMSRHWRAWRANA